MVLGGEDKAVGQRADSSGQPAEFEYARMGPDVKPDRGERQEGEENSTKGA